MYYNQSILKKHSALSIGRKDVQTSLILFPVRLETRFVEDHLVEDVSEPDKALYAFQSLWDYVDSLEKASTDTILANALTVMRRVEALDAVYREDKQRLATIVKYIVRWTKPQGDLKDCWDRVATHVSRLSTLDVISDNEATEFLRQLDRVNRTIWKMRDNPRYKGRRRKNEIAYYSSSAFFKDARKNLAACFPILEQLLPEDPTKTIVNRFALITPKQYDKFINSLAFMRVGKEDLDKVYGTKMVLSDRKRKLKLIGQLQLGLQRDIKRYEDYRVRYCGGKDTRGQTLTARGPSLRDKMTSKTGVYYRYTFLAQRLICWRLRQVANLRTLTTQDVVKKWRNIADNTVFSFDRELEWLVKLVKTFNASHGKDETMQVSVSRLKRHTKAIRKRKISYFVRKKCLLVRIFPDEIAVTQMLKPVTRQEMQHALTFWATYFYHGGNELRQKAAFKSLCSLYGAPRAAYIARNFFSVQKTLGLDAIKKQVDGFRKKDLPLEEIVREFEASMAQIGFAGLSPDGEGQTFTVPMSELMPDRFILQARLDNGNRKSRTIVRYGHLIPASLQVGIDLNRQPTFYTGQEGVKFTDNLRWMTDYDEAERMGMAITLPLDSFQLERRGKPRTFVFESIYVMGVKELSKDNRADSERCSMLLAKLFNTHLYSNEGLELLKIGTPTNILDDKDLAQTGQGRNAGSSEYDTAEDAQQESFFRKSIQPFCQGVKSPIRHSDVDLLTKLFCFDKLPNVENPFANVAGCNHAEIRKARFVRKAFLEVLQDSHPLLKAIANSARLRFFFLDNVSPVGIFPPFRIGSQPYGIVPVCDFKNLKYGAGDRLEMMRSLLLQLADHWNALAKEVVLSEANLHTGNNLRAEEKYLQAVSATPVSKSFYSRKALKEPDLLSPLYFRGKKQGVDPVTTLYNAMLPYAPGMTLETFIQDYLPAFGYIPLKEPCYAKPMDEIGQNGITKKYDWRGLKEAISKRVMKFTIFKDVSDQELEELITATFDLFNYRLDAWLTGLLGQRLSQRTRYQGSHKIALGAYGWVFNLKEDKAEAPSEEFIVAPSVSHALTASVLRSSFARAAEGRTKDYSLGVNLSSSRVRQALRIIQGIRNGLSLGAILGSDLERMLHDDVNAPGGMSMDFFIYYLRTAYPLNNTTQVFGKGTRDSSLDVLNGVALLEDLRKRAENVPGAATMSLTQLYKRLKDSFFNNWLVALFHMNQFEGLFNPGECEKTCLHLIELIQRMEDSYDALADVVTSESVYKLTQGNRVAVEALMNSMNTGRNFPEPEVTEIPLESAHIENRVFAALNPKPDEAFGTSVFSLAEPALDHWMGRMLGVSGILFNFVDIDAAVTIPVGVEGLCLTPSELVYLSGDWESFRNFLKLRFWALGLAPKSKPGIYLEEAAMAIDSMREILSRARPLKQEDLIANAVPPKEEAVCVDELQARFKQVLRQLGTLAGQLDECCADVNVHFKNQFRSSLPESIFRKVLLRLLDCYRIGFNSALSGIDLSLFIDADRENEMRYGHPVEYAEILSRQEGLADILLNHKAMIEERAKEAQEILREAEAQGESMAEAVPKAIKKLLISNFIVIPHFEIQDNETLDVAALKAQTADPKYFNNVSRTALEDNLVSLADVRTPLAALHQVRMYGKWNFLPAAREIGALQMEPRADEADRAWMGVAVKDENSVRDANVYTVLGPSELVVEQNGRCREVAGLMIDYWVERIPYRRQTAALAFSYDQPDAEPPQAILVGVATLGSKHRWSQKRMLRTIHSAMYQVKSRAVEPEHVYADKWTSAFFPALSIDPENPIKR